MSKVRITSSIRRIIELFDALPKKEKYLLARDAIDKLGQVRGGSRITLMRARKALGIRAVKIAGSWRWPRPQFTLEQALIHCNPTGRKGTAYRVRVEKDFTPVYVTALRSILRQFNYDALATDVKGQLRERRLHNNKFTKAAKSQMGVIQVWIGGHWHWILPSAPPVHEWLEQLLLRGDAVLIDTVMKKAAEKGWSSKLIWKVKEQKSEIKLVIKNGKKHWQDLANRSIGAVSSAAPEVIGEEDDTPAELGPSLVLDGGEDFAPAPVTHRQSSPRASRTAARIKQLEEQVAQLLQERNITHD